MRVYRGFSKGGVLIYVLGTSHHHSVLENTKRTYHGHLIYATISGFFRGGDHGGTEETEMLGFLAKSYIYYNYKCRYSSVSSNSFLGEAPSDTLRHNTFVNT